MKKFILLASILFSYSTLTPTLAAQAPSTSSTSSIDVKTQIKESINQALDKQIAIGTLTKKPHINISLIPSLKTIRVANIVIDKNIELPQNNAVINNNHNNNDCTINLVFDDEGNIPHLDEAAQSLHKLQLKNKNQIMLAQQFVALHESFHCEFRSINEPIVVQGKDRDFNKKINYLLKDEVTHALLNKIAYIDLLNENFADVAATLAMIKQYGVDNQDVNDVINTIILLRHIDYIRDEVDIHFSHFSMQDAFSKNTFSELSNINPNSFNSDFKNLALKISNNGTFKVISNKKALYNYVFTNNPIPTAIYLNVLQLVIRGSIDSNVKEVVIINPWLNNVERGFSFVTADKIVQGENILSKGFYTPEGNTTAKYNQLHDYVAQLLKEKEPDLIYSSFYKSSQKLLKEFQDVATTNIDKNNVDYIENTLTSVDINQRTNNIMK